MGIKFRDIFGDTGLSFETICSIKNYRQWRLTNVGSEFNGTVNTQRGRYKPPSLTLTVTQP